MNVELATMTAERLFELLKDWKPAQLAKRLKTPERDILGLMRHFKIKQPKHRHITRKDHEEMTALRRAGLTIERAAELLRLPLGTVTANFEMAQRMGSDHRPTKNPKDHNAWPDFSSQNYKIKSSSMASAARNGRVAYSGSLVGNSSGMCVDGIGAFPVTGRR